MDVSRRRWWSQFNAWPQICGARASMREGGHGSPTEMRCRMPQPCRTSVASRDLQADPTTASHVHPHVTECAAAQHTEHATVRQVHWFPLQLAFP